MGSGSTQLCAQSGYQVLGFSGGEDRLKQALATIDSRLTKKVEKGTLSQEDKDSTIDNIKGTTNLKDFRECDLVIESAVEDINLKRELFTELDEICDKRTILATNTSCLSIVDIAMSTKRPGKVLGLHFLSPVPQSKLMEIVKTIASSDETLEIGKWFASSLRKSFIVAQDTPGFIFNRLYIGLTLIAVRMLETGIAAREEIDSAMTLGLGHAIGPLALADFNGVDVILMIADAMYQDLKDPFYAPPLLMRKMVAAGWLGRKTGKGFYNYD